MFQWKILSNCFLSDEKTLQKKSVQLPLKGDIEELRDEECAFAEVRRKIIRNTNKQKIPSVSPLPTFIA